MGQSSKPLPCRGFLLNDHTTLAGHGSSVPSSTQCHSAQKVSSITIVLPLATLELSTLANENRPSPHDLLSRVSGCATGSTRSGCPEVWTGFSASTVCSRRTADHAIRTLDTCAAGASAIRHICRACLYATWPTANELETYRWGTEPPESGKAEARLVGGLRSPRIMSGGTGFSGPVPQNTVGYGVLSLSIVTVDSSTQLLWPGWFWSPSYVTFQEKVPPVPVMVYPSRAPGALQYRRCWCSRCCRRYCRQERYPGPRRAKYHHRRRSSQCRA